MPSALNRKCVLACSGDEETATVEQYNSNDIAEGLNETANDSRADTTIEAEVTQDSVAM